MKTSVNKDLRWYLRAFVGDVIRPVGLWNRTTDNHFWHLPSFVTILDIAKNMNSETGVAFKVKLVGGSEIWMDANWFRSQDDNREEYHVRGPKGQHKEVQRVPVHEAPYSATGQDEGGSGSVREGGDLL